MANCRDVWLFVWRKKTFFIFVLTPILLCPLLIVHPNNPAARCAYVVLLTGVLWVFLPKYLTVTALLPAFLFPLMEVLTMEKVLANYMEDITTLFLAVVIVATAVERYDLHRRIAWRVLLSVGSSPKSLLFGIMCVSAFFSMWTFNIALVPMMWPIAAVVVEELEKADPLNIMPKSDEQPEGQTNIGFENGAVEDETVKRPIESIEMNDVTSDSENVILDSDTVVLQPRRKKGPSKYEQCFSLGLIYGLNVGGVGTVVGNILPLLLNNFIGQFYGPEAKFNFGTWMIYAIPTQVVVLVLAWLWLSFALLDLRQSIGRCFTCESKCCADEEETPIITAIRREYVSLGRIKWAEVVVIFIFVVLFFIWLFENPRFVEGWQAWFTPGYVTSTTFTVGAAILCFIIPANAPTGCDLDGKTEKHRPILDWKYVERKVPWGMLIFLGGILATMAGIRETGISELIADVVKDLVGDWEPWVVVVGITCVAGVCTEFVSGAAAFSIFFPVTLSLTQVFNVHPYYFNIALAMACNLNYCLPAAHPVNALMVTYGTIHVPTMFIVGLLMNILSLLIVNISINTYGYWYFNMDTMPDWALPPPPVNLTSTMAAMTVT